MRSLFEAWAGKKAREMHSAKECYFHLIFPLPCWSTGMIQMRRRHSPYQVQPPLHQSPPAMWPAVHPETQNLRVRQTRGGRTAGSLDQRTHHHTCKKNKALIHLLIQTVCQKHESRWKKWPAVTVVTPAVSMTHAGTLLTDVDVVQRPLILLSIVALDPSEPGCTGPEHKRKTPFNSNLLKNVK